MKLSIISDNPYGQNIYVYYNEETREGVIIDASDSLETVKHLVVDNALKIKAVLLTHGHFDHIFRAKEICKFIDAPLYAHEDEAALLQSPEMNRSDYRGLNITARPDKLFRDGDVFDVGGVSLKVIHTPGHTAGGVCYYDAANGVIFTGDTLFRETIGRTDMPTGDHATLVKSINEKLFILPDEVTVYPGHGEASTIGHEKKNNTAMGV